MKEVTCPHCGQPNDSHRRAPGQQPKPDDISLCWTCRKPSIFTVVAGVLGARLPTDEELTAIEADPDYREAKAAMAESYGPLTAVWLMRQGRWADG